MSALKLTDIKSAMFKIRNNKTKIKGLLALKKKLERGEFLEIAIMAMLEKEHENYPRTSTISNLKATGGTNEYLQ